MGAGPGVQQGLRQEGCEARMASCWRHAMPARGVHDMCMPTLAVHVPGLQVAFQRKEKGAAVRINEAGSKIQVTRAWYQQYWQVRGSCPPASTHQPTPPPLPPYLPPSLPPYHMPKANTPPLSSAAHLLAPAGARGGASADPPPLRALPRCSPSAWHWRLERLRCC